MRFFSTIACFLVFDIFSGSQVKASETWSFGAELGGFHFRDEDFLSNLDVSSGAYLGFKISMKLNEDFSLSLRAVSHASTEELGSVREYIFNNFVGLIGEYHFWDPFYIRLGPGIVAAYNTLRNSDPRFGFGSDIGLGWTFWQSTAIAMDWNLSILPQWYQSDDGGMAYLVATGIGFNF
ncbi:MAG: hypothetical protein COV44_05085 [Deltaproteobacteria bacterium CG11_big_fil_rev_8_21_14_0_20_45_16]|nr:MAG: hypothetical protein COV44_05085 [Deltaproteobacteria bacterium CG11_big_fil_rev_8_21_14_0_20_45_16]